MDIKPDQSIAIPENLSDVRAILDQQSEINDNFPGLMDLAADDYFIDHTTWQSKPVDDQMLYILGRGGNDGRSPDLERILWGNPHSECCVGIP
ncbi:hypothetical protein [Sphingobacterium daejeonense]|uniref:hypothetical protein n=1 Tax=Sphingobacterium daejeonense TaxID=371142 RepID=UPI0014855E28|nr:hypothetical protein [Sphingobacterium daejeonense]